MAKSEAERRLEEHLLHVERYRHAIRDYENAGNAVMVAVNKRRLETVYALIRNHCEGHGLAVPHDVPGKGVVRF